MNEGKIPRIWAVDFDGTLCANRWPGIGAPNAELIEFLKWRRKKGELVILVTMREGDLEKMAVEWCRAHGLEFDAVNDNLPAVQEYFGNNPRKIYANSYIDDHNLTLRQVQQIIESVRRGKEAADEQVSQH